MDSIRAQLDELMGTERNIPLADRKKRKEHYDDPEVCKYQLVAICPHDLFPNTKCDLGACPKRHDDTYKKMFLEDDNRANFEKKYINETISLFESLLHGVDSKIKKAQSKLDQAYVTTEQPKELQEKLDAIDEEVGKLVAQTEILGDEGKLEELEACMAQIESLKKRKEEMKLAGDPNLGAANRQMKVCEICGAMQALNDTEKRSQAHYEGKLHTGFAILRKELDNLKKRRDELRNMNNPNRRDKEKERDQDREREREHSGDRNESRRRRSRSRSNRRESRRSRSPRRRSTSRDRDRDRKSRSHRDRGDRNDRGDRGDRDRKDRRDRDRHRRSRSRSGSRSGSSGRKHKKSHKRDRSRERREDKNGENHNSTRQGEEVPAQN